MSRHASILFLFLVLVSGATLAQTPDGETPANEGVCDDLVAATPGLYGLCIAFCEAQDCEPDFWADDPFADCRPSAPKLLERYNARKNAGDPDMPCIMEPCPCWAADELAALRDPVDESVFCLIASGPGFHSSVLTLVSNSLPPYRLSLDSFFDFDLRRGCHYEYEEPGQYVNRHFVPITGDEEAACTEQIIQLVNDFGFDCIWY